MGPDLRQVEWVEAVGFGLGVGHDLNKQRPAWMIAARNGFEQVTPMVIGVHTCHILSFLISETLHTLVGMEVILHPKTFALSVDPHVRVRAVAIHMPPRSR